MSLEKLLPENLRTLRLSPASLRHPLPPRSPPRIQPERWGTQPGVPSQRDLSSLGSPLPPTATTSPQLEELSPSQCRKPEQTRGPLATFLPASLAWRLLGEMSRGAGISAGPKLLPKALAEKESVRVGWELQILLLQASLPPLLTRPGFVYIGSGSWEDLPTPFRRPALPVRSPGSRTWSTPASSRQKAGDLRRGVGGRASGRIFAICLPSPAPSLPAIPAQIRFGHPPFLSLEGRLKTVPFRCW